MKELLSLADDYIFTKKFIANKVDNQLEYVDETKEEVKGRLAVASICWLVDEVDTYGNRTGVTKRVFLNLCDLREIMNKIKEIESTEATGPSYNDDLPW